MNKSLLIGVLIGLGLAGIAGAISLLGNAEDISSFEDCAAANNRIAESYPRQCFTEDGRVFVEDLENNQPQVNAADRRSLDIALPRSPKSAQQFAYTELVSRQTSRDDVARYVVEEIILGPTEDEKSDGFFTPIEFNGDSNCGGEDFTLEINESSAVAKLQFCRPLNTPGPGDDIRIQSSIVRSLSLLPEIASVIILDHTGNCFADLSGSNACLKN